MFYVDWSILKLLRSSFVDNTASQELTHDMFTEHPSEMIEQTHARRPPTWVEIAQTATNWMTWSCMALLVSSQLIGIVWNTKSYSQSVQYGQASRDHFRPTLQSIPGTNDEPYADRSMICLAQGRSYAPMQLSHVLRNSRLAIPSDSSGSLVNGYRVVARDGEATIEQRTTEHFVHVCELVDRTLETIQDNCEKLGYNVTRDELRIVVDVDSKVTQRIPNALPILIMPFWDNSDYVHYAIPGWDGMACLFRLDGAYALAEKAIGVMRVVPRDVREQKTAEWLGRPNGVWRNGWYEDDEGERWSSSMMTTNPTNPYGLRSRQFSVFNNEELECSSLNSPSSCRDFQLRQTWGKQSWSTDAPTAYSQVYISNGSHFGVFLFDGTLKRTITNAYSLETFISNITSFILLFRWFVAMAAMLNSYRLGLIPWQTTGIGCLACSRTFNILPIVMLPRLKMILAAFWSVGCEFEGQQRALGEAWFAVYPAIVELTLYYFSVLNFVSKVTYRRMSDSLFGPTMLAFTLLHRVRLPLAKSGWLGVDSRVPTQIMSEEFDNLGLVDLFRPSIVVRLNGGVGLIVNVKLVILAVNILPLFFSENMSTRGKKFRSFAPCQIEKTLAIRASNVGGLGRSEIYDTHSSSNPRPLVRDRGTRAVKPALGVPSAPTADQLTVKAHEKLVHPFDDDLPHQLVSASHPSHTSATSLSAYEFNRLGYIVFGGHFVLSFDDWYILTSLAPLRVLEKLWNHRIIVFDVTKASDGYYVSRTARVCRLDDPQLQSIAFYDVTLCVFR